ncbi:hypothetical protein SAMN02982985_01812 [Rugamonas rubra]|uniref:Uncharacterized protein n=2 Tax=Rugamonas rubra TaxID=758825 RepID=A0A1I4L3J6_9BURK|nr:hypothetical protein SAMN02982985_01812 [Rugamonas rubra]
MTAGAGVAAAPARYCRATTTEGAADGKTAQRGDRHLDEEEQAADIALQPLGAFCRQAVLPSAVLLGYTALTLAQLRYAGQKLARLLARARAESAR